MLNFSQFNESLSSKFNKTVDIEDIKATSEFKFLTEEWEVVFISSKAQISHNTIVFGIPTENAVINNNNRSKYLIKSGAKYLEFFYALYNTGDIRKLTNPEFGRFIRGTKTIKTPSPTRTLRRQQFDPNTLEGWKIGLEKVKTLLLKRQKKLAKEDIFFFLTKEEMHNNRGRIHGSKYDL